jgi:hypothetical protein
MSVDKPKKQICIRLVTADQGGQKNRNGKTTAVVFLPHFLLVLVVVDLTLVGNRT